MQRHFGAVIDTVGNAIGNVQVTVFISGTSSLATIFSDNGVTQLANPFNSDIDGQFAFYAQNGRYDLALFKSGEISETQTDVVLFDPDDAQFGSPPPRGHVDGLITSIVSAFSETFQVSPGIIRAVNGNVGLELTSTLGGDIQTGWASGSFGNKLPASLSFSGSNWYHVFLLGSADGSIVEIGVDTDFNAANLLADPSVLAFFGLSPVYARIRSFRGDGFSSLRRDYQFHDWVFWADGFDETDAGSTSPATLTLNGVPPGDNFMALVTSRIEDFGSTSNGHGGLFEPLIASSGGVSRDDATLKSAAEGGWQMVMTNTSQQIGWNVTDPDVEMNSLTTFGYWDPRSRNS